MKYTEIVELKCGWNIRVKVSKLLKHNRYKLFLVLILLIAHYFSVDVVAFLDRFSLGIILHEVIAASVNAFQELVIVSILRAG